MAKKIFEKWEDLQNEGIFHNRQIYDLYEEEGRGLLNSLGAQDSVLDQGWATTFRLTSNILKEILKKESGKRELTLLDLGCGASPRLLSDLETKTDRVALRYIGGEISPSKLKVFNRIASCFRQKNKYGLVCLDCSNLPFRKSVFDIVVCDETIEHLPEPCKAISEITRILKDGGVAIISTPNRNRPDVLIRKCIDFLQRNKKDKVSYYMAISHLTEFTHQEFAMLLKKSGLTVKKSFILNYPFGIAEIKKAGYFSKVPSFLLLIPYKILNMIIALFKQKGLSTHIFLLCFKNIS